MGIQLPPLDFFVIAPEIALLVTALAVMMLDLVLPSEQKRRLAWLSLVGVGAATVLSLYLWQGSTPGDVGSAPKLQDMFVADGYALFFNLVILTGVALALLFSVEYVERVGLAQGEYYTLLLLSATGMLLMAAAINLMTIFLALEILSIALYVLVGLNRADQRSAEGSIKYFLLGAFASGFLLYGMALAYGQAGGTSLAALRDYVSSLGTEPPLGMALALGLMIVGFGFKIALVPFHMWTPDAYQGAPTSVTAFMSVGAKAAAFAALTRVVHYAFGQFGSGPSWLLAVLAALTMTLGNLSALRQSNLKRMLAYSSIAHAGYMLIGVAAGNEAGTSAVAFYLLVYAVMNAAAFGVIIAVGRFDSSAGAGETLDDFAGLGARKPALAVAMTLLLLSLAGLPPLAGFLAKLYVFGAAVEAGLTWLAVLGVVNSVISAYYYLRVVAVMYMREGSVAEASTTQVSPALQVGVGLAALAVVILGIWPAAILEMAAAAVKGLLGG
jgi:NADH-quinone oxidoreductase subunit N